jgi:hypothetical protein
MAKEMVKVGEANNGELNLDIDVVKTWDPKDINYIGLIVFFKNEKTYYSMTRDDFKKIFNK